METTTRMSSTVSNAPSDLPLFPHCPRGAALPSRDADLLACIPPNCPSRPQNVALVVVLLLLLLPVSSLTKECTLSQLPLLQQRALQIEETMAMSVMQKFTQMRTQHLEMRLAVVVLQQTIMSDKRYNAD